MLTLSVDHVAGANDQPDHLLDHRVFDHTPHNFQADAGFDPAHLEAPQFLGASI